MSRILTAALLLQLGVPDARAQWIELPNEMIAYDALSARYDAQQDIVGVVVDDIDYGEFWLYFQCGTDLSWFPDPAPGQWDRLEPEYRPIRDDLCARRHSLLFQDF